MPRRNITLYYLFSFFQDFALVYPVYLIYFREVGLDFLEVSWLLAIWGVPVLVMEIPSGIVADLWSRKWSLVAGMALKAAGFVVWLVRPDFAGFALGFVLWGLQEGICTGVVDALLYDGLRDGGEEQRFVEVSGRGAMLARVGIIVSVLLGGFVFSFSESLVLAASAASMLVAGVAAAGFDEGRLRPGGAGGPRPSGSAPAAGESGNAGSRSHAGDANAAAGGTGALRPGGAGALLDDFAAGLRRIVAAVRAAAAVRGMLAVVLFGALAVVVYGVLDEYDFLFGQYHGVPVAFIGVWGAARFLLEGLGASFAYRFERRLGLDSPFRLALWMACAAMLLLAPVASGIRALLIFYFLFYCMMAAAEVIFHGWIHHRIESQGRATIASLVSFVYEAFGLLIVLLLGPISQSYGLPALFLAGATLVLLAAAIFAAAVRSLES